MPKVKEDSIKGATQALSDLNVFYIVISILEGGHLHANSYRGAQRIIEICKREAQKRLREHDKAIEDIYKVQRSRAADKIEQIAFDKLVDERDKLRTELGRRAHG